MVSTKPSDTKNQRQDGVVLNERGEEVPADKATAQRPQDAGKNPAPQPQSPGQPAGGE